MNYSPEHEARLVAITEHPACDVALDGIKTAISAGNIDIDDYLDGTEYQFAVIDAAIVYRDKMKARKMSAPDIYLNLSGMAGCAIGSLTRKSKLPSFEIAEQCVSYAVNAFGQMLGRYVAYFCPADESPSKALN